VLFFATALGVRMRAESDHTVGPRLVSQLDAYWMQP
jgi:hypothetical protein